ncbi:hypothetical protein KY342_03855 [Candidatus Woesearchaeota archaeon]|nr:hypothetical protein [Candidatus Woesearchaeota archaeon]
MSNISKDTPLAEITLRRYEKPNLTGRDLVRKFCLTLGLLQPGDSRDVIVDVLYAMLKEKRELTAEQIREKVVELRKEKNLPLLGIASSNVRRQLKRLRDIFILEKVANVYRINERASLSELIEEKIEKVLLSSVISRAKEYSLAIDQEFSNHEE